MRWTVALTLLSVGLLALAGCSGKDKDTDDDAGPSATSSTTTRSPTTAPAPAANRPPTATMAVALNGTSAMFNLTGSDPDGDALSWNLTFGDGSAANGTSLPASANHTYAAGNYTANFTVSDGNATHSYDVAITIANATAGAGGEPVATMTGTVVGPDPLFPLLSACGAELIAGEGTGGNAGNFWQVDSSWIGLAYAVEPATLWVTFFDGAGFPTDHAGTVPPDAIEVAVCGSEPTDVAVDFTLTIG